MLVRSVANVRGQTVAIVRIRNLGEGQIHRNLLRHTKLIQIDVRIRRNDRTSREVDTLSHQVTANTSRLGTEARLQCAERTSRPLSRRSQTLDVIVHIRCHVVLNHGRVLVNHLGRLALVEFVTQTLVVAKNVNQLVGEVILHPLIVIHHNRGTNRQGRHGQHGTNHPLGTRVLVVEANHVARLVRDTLECPQNQLNLNRHGWRRLVGVADWESLQRGCLASHTSNLAEEGRVAVLACRRLLLTLRADLGYDIANLLEPSQSSRLNVQNLLGPENHARAVEADDVAQLLNPVEELVEIHGPSQRNVPEVTWAELVGVLAGGADLAVLNDAEAGIEDAIRHRLLRLVGLVGGNLHDAPLENVVGVCNAKLNSSDDVAHFTSYTVPCKVFVLPPNHVNRRLPKIIVHHDGLDPLLFVAK